MNADLREHNEQRAKIQKRIENTPELKEYRAELEHDWEGIYPEHAEWVATAPVAEIADWAEAVRDM